VIGVHARARNLGARSRAARRPVPLIGKAVGGDGKDALIG
jgi:hypothetical protein